MDCEKIINQLCDELAEDINSEFCSALKKHLESCEQCRNLVSSVKNTVNLFKCLDEQEVPKSIHERLVKLLNVPDIQSEE